MWLKQNLMKITLIAGARPNFMKIAPLIRAIDLHNEKHKERAINYQLVHTGQHYDDKLSQVFFEELGLPTPSINLGAGSGTQAEQTAKIMIAFEKYLSNEGSDLVVVVGDVTSTMACTIVAKKLQIKVAHIEAGIRSFDMAMPEEINRIVTDSLADYFFTTTEIANQNLLKSGIQPAQIFLVGNTMIDSLVYSLEKLKQPDVWSQLNLTTKGYYLLTLHRPSNVDDLEKLEKILDAIEQNPGSTPVIFPIHPRTKNNFDKIAKKYTCIKGIEPLSYFQFIYLIKNSKAIITDSGGVQEETTFLGIPCVTIRANTERPETVTLGTNELVGEDLGKLRDALIKIDSGNWKIGSIPALWDGKTAERIVKQFALFDCA